MKYGFIGTGCMGGALATAFAKAIGPEDILLSNRSPEKAQALAEASNKTLAGVVHVEEFGYQPETRYASYNAGGSAKMAAAVAEDAAASVMPGQVSVEAQVTVSY